MVSFLGDCRCGLGLYGLLHPHFIRTVISLRTLSILTISVDVTRKYLDPITFVDESFRHTSSLGIKADIYDYCGIE